MTLTPNNAGWIEVICGSMFSGKTEELIRRIRRAEIAKMKTIIFKPKIDSRYSSNHIVSHNQSKLESVLAKNANEIIDRSVGMDVIGIDEAQFFDKEIVSVCNDLANKGIRVIVAGLDMDFKGKPFGPMPDLMATAEYVTKVHAVCTKTGNLAHFSHRKVANENIVMLGEVEEYEPLSRAAYFQANKDRENEMESKNHDGQ